MVAILDVTVVLAKVRYAFGMSLSATRNIADTVCVAPGVPFLAGYKASSMLRPCCEDWVCYE